MDSSEEFLPKPPEVIKGRGTGSSISNRYHSYHNEWVDDGWDLPEENRRIRTQLIPDRSRSIITRNNSPDVPFDRSVNPYRGCEHGCVYCYARPTHAWLDMSPGIDFETRLLYKQDAADLLRQQLSAKTYQCKLIGIGTNTDAWQPIEKRMAISREILQVLLEFNHPVRIVTKSTGILRDLDLLKDLASRNLVAVNISVCTLDDELGRKLEPRAASSTARLRCIEKLSQAGIPTGVIVAPVIPILNDSHIEKVLESSRSAGAHFANYIFIRLPLEVSPLFREWLELHYPLKAAHIMNRIKDSSEGKDYQSKFGQRMKGKGIYADLIKKRFEARYRLLNFPGDVELRTDLFKIPGQPKQLALF